MARTAATGVSAGPASHVHTAAAARCTVSRIAGCTPRRSSSNDTAMTARSGPSHGLAAGKQSVPANQPAQIATPPPRGSARTCSERALGTSRGRRPARRINMPRTAQLTAAAIIAANAVIALLSLCANRIGPGATLASRCSQPFLRVWAIERRRGDRRGNYTRRDTPAAPFQKRRLVAIKQQALQGVLGPRVLACQRIRRFGTMASTSRYLLRRFPMAGARPVHLPIFSVTRRNFMNKKLVALAVAGAFTLPPLAAQAQTANVTLYGRLNIDFEFIRGKTCAAATAPVAGAPGTAAGCFVGTPQDNSTNPTVNRLSSNSSRLGVRGTESLGGGLNAIFQIESSINGDTNAGNLGGRETFVGLQGSWGKFTAGRFLAPQDDLHPIFGNATTLTTSILSTADLWAQGTLNKAQGGFDARLGNSLRYDSPNWSGFTAALQYSTRDSSGNADSGDNGDHVSELRHARVWGGNVISANGPCK